MSSLAMASERRHAGAAFAVLGCMPFLLGGIISPLMGLGDIFIVIPFAMATCVVVMV
ncbi:hypothetical protein [Neisseria iguanae]|uniref:hypothetical protein n=1 Tax=Neisseria iguanae TaxID=90242 RepID=UPI0014740E6D|nr:hypothetical protein [Neisseria iguanae]